MAFFVSNDSYKRTVRDQEGEEGEITLRRLNAGDQAAIQDTLRMSLSEDADASLAIGTMRMLTVQRALLDWSWPGPKPSPEAISQLEPEVFEQIYAFCEIGTPPTEAKPGTSSANGEAPEATEETEASDDTVIIPAKEATAARKKIASAS